MGAMDTRGGNVDQRRSEEPFWFVVRVVRLVRASGG